MPARPMILDEIDVKIKGTVAVELTLTVCCVASCRKSAGTVLSLRYSDGRSDVYALCKEHLKEMRDRHPSKLEKESKRGAFFYAGS